MSEGTFEKVGESDERLFGPRKILVCGFPASAQLIFKNMLSGAGLGDIPVVFAALNQAEKKVGDLLELPGGSGTGQDSGLAIAVILSGVTEAELHAVIRAYRAEKLPVPLWATLTEISAQWKLKDLLHELASEREAFARHQGQEK
jgi:hypothetical protein